MHVERRHTTDELARLVKKERNARVATRLRAVLLAARGRTNTEKLCKPGLPAGAAQRDHCPK